MHSLMAASAVAPCAALQLLLPIRAQVELSLSGAPGLVQDDQVVAPRHLCQQRRHLLVGNAVALEQLPQPSPRRCAPHEARRRPQPSAPRWALSWGIRRAPKGGLATGQPKRSDRATRCETPLLERSHTVSAQRPRCGAGASALGAAPRRERPRQASNRYAPGMAFRLVPNPACVRVMQNQPGSGGLVGRRHDEQSRRQQAHAHT